MATTAGGLIRGALQDLGVLDAGSAGDSDDLLDALIALNQLADGLGLQRLTLYQSERVTKTLTASTASYTIGPSASINTTVRPTWIDAAGLIQNVAVSPSVEIPITVLTDDEWRAITQKALTSSQSSAVFYDHGLDGSGFGTIYPIPIPTGGATALVLYLAGGQVSQFADLTTNYVLPNGWERMLRKNLALEIAPMFQVRQIVPWLPKQAQDSLADVKAANVRPIPLRADPATLHTEGGGRYNPLTGMMR